MSAQSKVVSTQSKVVSMELFTLSTYIRVLSYLHSIEYHICLIRPYESAKSCISVFSVAHRGVWPTEGYTLL